MRKTLRVTSPVGMQRSTYFVQMPMRYGVPMIASMALLHYLISQSIFLYAIEVHNSDGSVDRAYGTDGVAYGVAYSIPAAIFGEPNNRHDSSDESLC